MVVRIRIEFSGRGGGDALLPVDFFLFPDMLVVFDKPTGALWRNENIQE